MRTPPTLALERSKVSQSAPRHSTSPRSGAHHADPRHLHRLQTAPNGSRALHLHLPAAPTLGWAISHCGVQYSDAGFQGVTSLQDSRVAELHQRIAPTSSLFGHLDLGTIEAID